MQGKLFLKKALDFVVSSVGLVLLSVPFAIIALAIKLDSKGSVFFRFSSYSAELGAM